MYYPKLRPVRTVAPSVAPISLDDVKGQSRIDAGDEDATLQLYIDAATSYLDGFSGILGRALITQTWRQDYPQFCWPWLPGVSPYFYPYWQNLGMRLAVGDVQSVTSVTYYDTNNQQQTLSTSIYSLMIDDRGAYIGLKPNQNWPTTYVRDDAVRVTYVSGYGDDATAVPGAIRLAMCMLVAQWYENRENVILPMTRATIQNLPFAVDALLAPFSAVGV